MAIRDGVLPAYVKFTAFVRDEYAPKGRTEPGVWALPDGAALYAFDVKQITTTDLTPEEIHQIGLAQVKEIAKQKMQDLNANDLEAASRMIIGSARSMGVQVVE